MNDLEVWMIGDPAAVQRATDALADAGTLAEASKPAALVGADAGRVRRYVRIHPASSNTRPAPTRRVATLLDQPEGGEQ